MDRQAPSPQARLSSPARQDPAGQPKGLLGATSRTSPAPRTAAFLLGPGAGPLQAGAQATPPASRSLFAVNKYRVAGSPLGCFIWKTLEREEDSIVLIKNLFLSLKMTVLEQCFSYVKCA